MIQQKRNLGTNIGLVVFPVILCLMLFGIQRTVNILTYMPQRQCECNCMSAERFIGSCRTECKMQYLDTMRGEVSTCPIPKPRRWPPLLQVPQPQFRAAKSASSVDNFTDLPHESCKEVGSCPVTVLVTGGNRSLAESKQLSFYSKVGILGKLIYDLPIWSHFKDLLNHIIGQQSHGLHIEGMERHHPLKFIFNTDNHPWL